MDFNSRTGMVEYRQAHKSMGFVRGIMICNRVMIGRRE